MTYAAQIKVKGKGKDRALDIAPQVTNLRGAQVHGAHKAVSHVPASLRQLGFLILFLIWRKSFHFDKYIYARKKNFAPSVHDWTKCMRGMWQTDK